jgi:hypothetical protein
MSSGTNILIALKMESTIPSRVQSRTTKHEKSLALKAVFVCPFANLTKKNPTRAQMWSQPTLNIPPDILEFFAGKISTECVVLRYCA